MTNIIGNAVKFTNQGGISVSMQAEQRWSGTIRVIIEIEDTGIGIAPKEIDKVFDQFEQAESGRIKGGGTGLGLPISRHYTRMMGGDLTVVQSEVGKGSIFRLEFNTKPDGAGEAAVTAVSIDRVQHFTPVAKARCIHLTPEALSVFPEDLRAAMREALEAGDMGLLLELIDQGAHRAPDVADALWQLADRYEYDTLMKLFERSESNA